MEEIKTIVIEHWSMIVEFVLMLIAYFLLFLFKSKVNMTKTNLTAAFKENMQTISKTDKKLRVDIRKELEDSKAKYNEAVAKIDSLQKELRKVSQTITILIGDTYEETDADTCAIQTKTNP